MTTPKYPILLGLIVITDENNALRFKEGSTTETVLVDEGVYFLRGNGTASDFCRAIKEALESNTNASDPNTYDVSIAFDRSPANPTATVTASRATGASTFQFLWDDAATTLDPALLGFERVDSDDDASDKVSTLSPSSLWVSNALFSSLEPVPSHERAIERSRGGVIRAVDRAKFRDRYWVQQHVEARRFHEEEIEDDPDRALSRFLARHADGKRFEFHAVDLDTGTTLAALSGDTKVATFVFTNDWYPRGARLGTRERGVPLYSVEGLLWKVRAALEVAEVEPMLPGAVFVLDPDDAASLTLTGTDIDAADNSGGSSTITLAGHQSGPPTLVAAELAGQDVARFAVDGTRVGTTDWNFNGPDGSVLDDLFGGQLASKSVYLVIKFDSIADAVLASEQQDCVVTFNTAGVHRFAINARRDSGSGVYSIVAHVNDGSVNSVEAAIALSTWHVVAVRHGAGTLEVSVDGGAWQSVAAGASVDAAGAASFGYGRYYGKGMDADVAFFATYSARHTDDEAAQNVAFLLDRFGLA